MEVHLYKQRNSRYWWVRYTDNGQLIRKSTKCTRKAEAKLVAEQIRKKWLQRQGIGIEEKLTLKELIREVENDYKANEKKSLDRVRYSSKHLIRLLGEETSLEDINEGLISKYKLTRKDEGAANGTINRELALLRRGFNLLRFQKRIIKPPVIKFLKESTPRQGFIEPWEFQEILKHLPLYLKPLITFLYKTGWRKSEALNLTWDMVDMEAGVIHLPRTKSGRPLVVPLSKTAKNILESLPRHEESPYVFTKPDGSPMTYKILHDDFQKACKRAGINPPLRLHDLRHSWASWMVAAGVPTPLVQIMGGWSTLAMLSRYSHASPGALAEMASKALPELLED